MIIDTILAALKAITPEQIASSAAFAPHVKPSDKVIGTVKSPMAKLLWALAHEYERQEELAQHSYKFDTHSDTVKEHLLRLGTRYAALEKITRSLAWFEMRDEIGAAAWEEVIHLRQDYTLVKSEPEFGDTTHVLELPSFDILQKIVDAIRSKALAEMPEPKGRKPQ